MRPLALGALAVVLAATGVLAMRQAATLRAEVDRLEETQADFALERTAAEAALRAEQIRLALERAREAPFTEAAPYLELILEDGRLVLGRGEARLREVGVEVELAPGIRAIERIDPEAIVLADGMTLRRAGVDSIPATPVPGEIPLLRADFEALKAVLRVGDLAYVH
ncbi:MAG: hypothetical protein RLZZ63_499 [Gemmatimonadota bacterium]|jgi:hypothetical protein